jgi:hypothetical protein
MTKGRTHLYRPAYGGNLLPTRRSLSNPNYPQYGAMSVALWKGNKEVYCDLLKLNTLKTYDLHRTITAHISDNKNIP